jgi:hypothetical protein
MRRRRFEMPNVGWNPPARVKRGEGEKAPDRPDALGGLTTINFQEQLLKVMHGGDGGIGTMGAGGAVGSGVAINEELVE